MALHSTNVFDIKDAKIKPRKSCTSKASLNNWINYWIYHAHFPP